MSTEERHKTDYTQIQLAEATGKTIAGASHSEGIVIRFTDKTFLYIDCDQYEDSVWVRTDSWVDLYDALRGGLIDQTEFDRVQAARDARRLASEREHYEYLKTKFENPKAE